MDSLESTTALPMDADLQEWLTTYSALSHEYQLAAAPKLAQIKALQAELAEETSHLTYQMEVLESLIKPVILAGRLTRKVPFVTVVYQPRDKWDKELLFSIAKEVPAVLTAYQDASFVQFRKTLT